MEVMIVKLRHMGKKLSPEEVKAAPRTRGFIAIKYWILKNAQEDRRVKELVLHSDRADASPIITRLQDVEQTRLKGIDMVYVGRELVETKHYPQAWWVTLCGRGAGQR